MDLALAFSLAATACYATLVVLVARRGLRLRVHQCLFFYLVMMLAWQLAYIMVSIAQTPATALPWYRISIAAAGAQCTFAFFFARALLHIRTRPIVIAIAVLLWVMMVIALITDRGHMIVEITRSPMSGLLVPEYGILGILVPAPSVGFWFLGIISLACGFRQATPSIERNRLRYVLLANVISFSASMANLVPSLIGFPVDVTGNIVCALLLAYAILRYQLADITVVVRRGLAYTLLTAALAVAYLLSILLFQRLVQVMVGVGTFLVPILVAVAAAFLLRPWREKIEIWIERLWFPEKYDSRRMLQELSRRTTSIIDLETLCNMLLNEICHTMHMERAALFMKEESSGAFTIAAQRGVEQGTGIRLDKDHPIVRWLLESEQQLHAHELDMLPQFRSLWAQEREDLNALGAELFVPLQVKGDLIGILAVGPKEGGGQHSQDDEITLSTLANQTAVAVENAHLFATTRARVEELTVLQDIGIRLVSSRTMPAVLQVIVESGIRLLAADRVFVALCDSKPGSFSVQRGISANGERCSLSASSAASTLMHAAVQDGRPIVATDLRLQPIIPPSQARQSQERAAAVFPLRRGEAVIGVLATAYQAPHSFTEEELRLLAMLADQATLAIDNAQLLELEQAKRQLADTLREASRVIGSTLDLDLLLDLVLEQIQNLVDYDYAAIALLENGHLQLAKLYGAAHTHGCPANPADPVLISILSDLAGQAKPAIIEETDQDERSTTILNSLHLRSLIAIPLTVREELRGILTIGRVTPDHYRPDELQNVTTFASQAAIVLENARLYRETIEEKRKTETILRETFSGILVTDVDLHIVTFNSGAEVITGYDSAEVIGKRLPIVLGEAIVAQESPLQQAMATGQRVPPQETMIQTAAGVRDVLQGATPLYDASYNLFGYLVSFTDITRLKEVDRLKTDLVANVSHELRTPLASIKAYTELLLDNVEGEDHHLRDQFLRIIDQETDRLSELISDLLDLSRMEAGRFEVRKSKLSIGELLTNVLALLDVQRRNRGLTIRPEIDDELPDLIADREMIIIILKNLIGNAIKFSHSGGEIVVRAQRDDDCLVLQVSDQGIGIPEEAIPNLFQKFYRVQSATESGIEGTGLGLVLTKQAVEAHGGTIAVKSQVGVGTVFTVRLPWDGTAAGGR